MPYEKKSRSIRKRKPRRKTKVVSKMPYLPVGGFPTRHLVKLRYCETFTLNPGVGSIATQAFRANSVYDPNQTGIGHQPSNYDIWTQIYDRYTVVGSVCRLYNVKVNTTTVVPGVVTALLTESGADISTIWASGGIDSVMEQPRLSRSTINVGDVSIQSGKPCCSIAFSGKKFFGKGAVIGAEPYTADVSANPAEGAFYEISYISADNSNDPGVQTFRAEIEYLVVFSEPKPTIPA